MNSNYFTPIAASPYASHVDLVYWALVGVTAFFTILISIGIIVFALRFRRKNEADVGQKIPEPKILEITWTVIPLIIGLILFAAGGKVYLDGRIPPEDAMEVMLVGKQWMWKFQHPNGRREINNLHVPVNKAVVLKMISQDVIHSMFFPSFRVKQDVVPMYYTKVWFKAERPGEYHIFCSQYCGKDHSVMVGKVTVMEENDYADWVTQPSSGIPMASGDSSGGAASGAPAEGPAAEGEKLFVQYACAGCHAAGSDQRGPNLSGLYGKTVKLKGGKTAVFDDNYIRESILNPMAKIVEGYEPLMPSFQGQLSEEQILQILAYLKSLGSK